MVKRVELDIVQELAELELELSTLHFESFDCHAALEIGLYLVRRAREGKKSVTIDVRMGSQQLFHCALEGTDSGNDQWIKRKNRVTLHFQKSSYYISLLLKSQNMTIEEACNLSSAEYAPFGGAYPIIIEKEGVIGTITVSGLPDHEDHEMVVDAIKWYLGQ